MRDYKTVRDGLHQAAITIRASQLLSTVCILGGAECPLLEQEKAEEILSKVKNDPTLTIRLESSADEVPYYATLERKDYAQMDKQEVLNRKRDLDVLQRLGLVPGSVRRARYLYTLLFERIKTPDGICAYETSGWEGCTLARSGAYESIRSQGWQKVVYCRSEAEMQQYRQHNVEQIANSPRLYIRPHHLMCLCCAYAGNQDQSPRPNDTIYEIHQRIRQDPEIPITLVEGCCMVCDSCDGFHPDTGRCVHSGGLIRDYKKDLDVFQKLGLMPGDTMKAKDLFDLLFERIHSAQEICGYEDGVTTSEEWAICGGVSQRSYERTRETGIF